MAVESVDRGFAPQAAPTVINLHGQSVFIPNRNIGIIGRYRRGNIRAYVDIQIPTDTGETEVINELKSIAEGMYAQHGSIILSEPEIFGVLEATPGPWRYLRIKFRLWPSQGGIIETTFKQRVVAAMKKINPDFTDWMVTVTYKVE